MAGLRIKFIAAIIVSVLAIAVTAAAFSFAPRGTLAEGSTVTLEPVEINSDTKYYYFDGARSVYADESGLLVAAENDIFSVTYDKDVSTAARAQASAVKRYGNYIISIEDGAVTSRYGDTVVSYTDKFAIDFDLCKDKLYAITESELISIALGETAIAPLSASVMPLTLSEFGASEASAIAVLGDTVYVAVKAQFGNKSDICSVDPATGVMKQCFLQSDPVIAMTALDGRLYALTRDKITCYEPSGGGLIPFAEAPDLGVTDICGYKGYIYAVTSLDALLRLPHDLSAQETLIASADGAKGFFNTPLGMSVKNSTLYVADSLNGRVVEYGADLGFTDGEFIYPVSVASDSAGTLYVAHRYNEVVAISGADRKTIKVNGVISQIAVDSKNTLFILTTDGALYRSDGFTEPTLVSSGFKAISLSVGREQLFALTDSAVKLIEFKDGASVITDYCVASATHFSLAVDFVGTCYLLSTGGITRVQKDGTSQIFTFDCGGSEYVLGAQKGQIILSTVGNKNGDAGFVSYGDAIVSDAYKHRVFTLSGETLGIKLIDENYNSDHPEYSGITTDKTPSYYGEGLIRTALYDAPMFSLPMETPAIYTIAEGRKVIVPEYDLDGTNEYSLVLIDDLATGKLISGYVYKESLSDPLPYVAPPSDVGTVYSNATPVYKWPSPNAQTVTGFSAIERGREFEILDFVQSYRDDYNNLWYRIKIADEFEGYMLAANISMMSYEPVFIRPAYDAEIISVENSEYAVTYALKDGKYVPLSVTLPTGTQVEVVGEFDTSEEYTQVKYLDRDLGTLTCYVRTEYLKYKGVNVVVLVAIIVLVITLVLAAIIIARTLYVKKKRYVRPSIEPDE